MNDQYLPLWSRNVVLKYKIRRFYVLNNISRPRRFFYLIHYKKELYFYSTDSTNSSYFPMIVSPTERQTQSFKLLFWTTLKFLSICLLIKCIDLPFSKHKRDLIWLMWMMHIKFFGRKTLWNIKFDAFMFKTIYLDQGPSFTKYTIKKPFFYSRSHAIDQTKMQKVDCFLFLR